MLDQKLLPPLEKAIAFLEKKGYKYAVIGGIAVAEWGFVRATRAVDFKVVVPDADYTKMRNSIYEEFPERARTNLKPNPLIVSVKIHEVIVDFLLCLPGYEETIIERAVPANFYGVTAKVCSVEDLLILKVIAGRGQDWQDIEGLLIEQRNKLDYATIEDWLRQFAEALTEPEMLVRYQDLKQKIDDLAKETF